MAMIDAPVTARKPRELNRQARTAWSLTTPALVLMFLILLVPVVVAGILSFTNYSLGNTGFDWVGFKNYDRLFSRSTYEKMFIATFTYVAVVVPVSVGSPVSTGSPEVLRTVTELAADPTTVSR